MAKMGRPITLPGFWGPLAAREGGVIKLATRLGLEVRTMRRWACNERSMDAVVASKIEDMRLPDDYFKVYHAMSGEAPDGVHHLVASAPEGWVIFPLTKGGWSKRVAWDGDPFRLEPGNEKKARAAGWPW